MLITKLKEELALLGFESSLENDGQLVTAVNRALRDLYNSRTITKTVMLAASGIQPIAYYKEIHLPAGKTIEIPVTGRAFSMKAHGILTYLIRDGRDANAYSVYSPYEATVIKSFMNYGGSVSIWGDYSMSVYDFAVYDRVYTDKREDIPSYGPTITFDLRKMYGDFMSFISPPRDYSGRIIENTRLYDGKLEIDSSYTGSISLSYRRLPNSITASDVLLNESLTIDVPEEYTHVFPLLVSYYLWLEDDETKSKYYRGIYDEIIKRIDASGYREIDCKYVDSNGWCK